MEITEIDRIVRMERGVDHGSYLTALLTAWQSADPENRAIMKTVMERAIEKYGMPTAIAIAAAERTQRMMEGLRNSLCDADKLRDNAMQREADGE